MPRLFLALILAGLVGPALAQSGDHRRFLLVAASIAHDGTAKPFPIENNTFSTKKLCIEEKDRLIASFAKQGVRLAADCMDRGSAY